MLAGEICVTARPPGPRNSGVASIDFMRIKLILSFMLDYDSIRRNERTFVALTGITPAEFQRLLPAFTRAYARAFPATKTHAGQARQRRPGGGRKPILLRPEDKLLFILVYQKAYPLQELLGS